MTEEQYKKEMELDRKRKLIMKVLFDDTLSELSKAYNTLESKAIMVKYENAIENYYKDCELSVKGSLGQNTKENK